MVIEWGQGQGQNRATVKGETVSCSVYVYSRKKIL